MTRGAGARSSTGAVNPRDLDPKIANILYHDRAAESYDDKWSIHYDDRTLAYAEDRVRRVLPEKRTFERALEVGAGTGFFLLHLWQGGWVRDGAATDISPGILDVCARNAKQLGWEIDTRVADAEALPFDDNEFDLVCGHAFLHHIPDPARCVREIVRVTRPGGTVLVAGEPTQTGHRIAGVVKKVTSTSIKLYRFTPTGRRWRSRAKTDAERELDDLESVVDLWEFEPARLAGVFEGAGLEEVRYVTEEFLASIFGWMCRTIEGNAPDGLLGARWAWFAYRNYMRLARIDGDVLGAVVPDDWYYNIVIAGEKPA